MNYHGKKVALTGSTGFLGKAIKIALLNAGADVYVSHGDLRTGPSFHRSFLNAPDANDPTDIDHSFSYLFHFGSPSSQVLFKRNPRYCISTTINAFLGVSSLADNNGIKLIYPSTGLLSQGQMNEYAMAKSMCEQIHRHEQIDALGIRLFAAYGPGEGHKRDYASVPYLFTRDIFEGRSPLVFGDGTQERNIIFIADAVQAILEAADGCNESIIDIGSPGYSVSFNALLDSIRLVLNSTIEANYVDRPTYYIDRTTAGTGDVYNFVKSGEYHSLREGIEAIVADLKLANADSNKIGFER